MRLSYYPGCSLHATAWEYDASVRAVCGRLDMELKELPDWNCCGATSAHATDEFLSLTLPLRNLALADAAGDDLLVPCAACYNACRRAEVGVRSEEENYLEANRAVAEVAGRGYDGRVAVRHPLELMAAPLMRKRIAAACDGRLRGLRVACYYGCLLVRPSGEVAFDDPEQPTTMDDIVRALGAEPVRWSYKTDCCGAGLSISRPEIVGGLVRDIVEGARTAGADVIATACPLCQANLDGRQERPETGEAPIPGLYFTELMGIALGLNAGKWLRGHLIDPRPALAKAGGAAARVGGETA